MQKNGGCRAIAEKNAVLSERVKKCNSLLNEKKFKNNDEKITIQRKKKMWMEGENHRLLFFIFPAQK